MSTSQDLASNLASALACFTSHRRQELGLSVARAAELAGLELSEWYALEAGWIPEDQKVIKAIAATLSVDWGDYYTLGVFTSWFQYGR